MICKNNNDLMLAIRMEMLKREIRMKDLSITMGMSQSSVAQIFKVANPKLDTLFKICNAIGLSVVFDTENKQIALTQK